MLTPEEIEGLELPRTFVGGYKPEKVTEHLRRVAWDIRRLLHERDVADAELARLRRELARSERREELEAAALGSAQRAAREIREASRQEAEVVLKKASEYATRLVRDVNREHAERTHELAELRAVNSKLRTQLRAFLKSLVEVVEAGDLEPNTQRRPVMADLDRVVQAHRAVTSRLGETSGPVRAPAAAPLARPAPAARPVDDPRPRTEVADDPRAPQRAPGPHALPLAGERPADEAERVA